MAVDYLKTYLGIDPNDYSSMEARIRGEEPQARTPVMMRQPMMMPQQRSLGDMEAMQLIPRQQPAPQVDDRYQGLTDQIVALKSQIEGMQAPQPAPQVDDRYQGLMDQIVALRSQIEGMQAPTEQAPVGAEAPVMADTPTEVNMDDAREMFYQSPEFKEYQRQTEGMAHDMAYRPQNYTDPTTGNTVSFQDRSGLFQDWYKNTYGRDLAVEDNSFRGSFGSGLGGVLDESKSIQAPVGIENRAVGEPEPIPQAPAEDIQASINYLAGLPKMNIPQIPDIEEIKRKMAEANMNFPEPVSYPDQLQAIRDLPPMTQMPTREEIQAAMQNIPAPAPAPAPAPVFTPAQTIQEKIQMAMQMPRAESSYSPLELAERQARARVEAGQQDIFQRNIKDRSKPAQTIQEKIQAIMQNMPAPTAPVSSMPKFNLPQMQSFGLPQQIAGGRTLMSDFSPRNVMRMASGGGIDKAIYDLKFKLNGS
jgi:hypothetical protein